MFVVFSKRRLLPLISLNFLLHQPSVLSFSSNLFRYRSAMNDAKSRSETLHQLCCGGSLCADTNESTQQSSIESLFQKSFAESFSPNSQIFDSHCHLQLDPLFEQRHDLMKNAMSLGVSRISVCGVCPGDDWNRINTLCTEYPDRVIGSYGLHPWWIRKQIPSSPDNIKNVEEPTHRWADQLELLLQQNLKAGVGECGLDKNLQNVASFEEQDQILTTHIHLACQYKRPLTIHCVGYWGRLLEILKREFEISNKKNRIDKHRHPPIILHSCNSMPVEMVSQFQKINCPIYFSLSAGGNFEKASKLIQAIPRELLLLETDSPDQLFGELKGTLKFNEPCVIRHYCDMYAQVLGIGSEELAQQLTANNLLVFESCL